MKNNIKRLLAFLLVMFLGFFFISSSAFAATSIKYGWMALDANNKPVLSGTEYTLSDEVRPITQITNNFYDKPVKIDPKKVVYLKNKQVGTAQALILGDAIPGYKDAFITTFKIVSKIDISKATDPKIPSQTYTGSKITPAFTIKCNGKTLTEKTDYTVKWGSNVNAGKGTAILTGIGLYNGTKKVEFTISAIPASAVKVDAIPTQKYTGKKIEPALKVTYKNKKLTESKNGKGGDYTVKYSNNIKTGTASVEVKLMGNYTGTKLASFKIISKTFSMKGKKAIVFGDSVQTAKYGEYIIYECKKLGAKKTTNRAVGGAMVANRNGSNNIQHQIAKAKKDGLLGKYDYYFIAAGVNDMNWGKHPLGKKTDTDANTVCGGINKAIKTINSAHVKATGYNAKIIVVTPTGLPYKQDKIAKYRKAIAETAKRHTSCTKVIDGTKISTNSEHARYCNGSVHPTKSFARKTMAPRVGKELNKITEWLITPTKAKK